MFAIIISEKGGAERRESFDKNEINVGRVQGNDLMLPKGNVSKHHARLLFRDGRFIVTDLKSTNGTYVNGRKIAQATIVREGDKIYIGDFVLRLEAPNVAAVDAPETGTGDESIRTLARDPLAPLPPPPAQPAPARPAAVAAVTLKAPTHPPGAPLPRPQTSNVSSAVATALGPAPAPAPPRIAEPPTPSSTRDKEIEESVPVPKPRGLSNPPPPVGGGAPRPLTMPLNQMSAPPVLGHRASPVASPAPIAAEAKPAGASPAAPAVAPAPPPAPSAARRASVPPARVPPKETAAQAGRRLALMTLLDRIADAVDLSTLDDAPKPADALSQQIERAAREQAKAMREEGDAPEGVDLDALARDAHRELVGLGAFAPLLEDDDVVEIHCVRFDQLLTLRADGRAVTEANAFSSEDGLRRAVARMAEQSGRPWTPGEDVVERRLARASFVAVAPPSSPTHAVTVRKRRRVESTLDELVGANALSKAMAQLLEACMGARANVLVSGGAPLPVVAALAAAGAGHRVAVAHDAEDVGVGGAHAVSVAYGKDGGEAVRAAVKLHADRLVVTQLAGAASGAALDAMTEGAQGVVAALAAPTLRQGLSRLVAQLVLHRPGTTLDGVREVVGEAIDFAVEATSFPDGRLRVTRIAELAGADTKGVVARDLFTWTADAGGEGSFSATGVVPRIANELAARGVKLDPALFKRGGR